jgi:alpha-beta hydrolase superfamily lysophospholipase
MRKFVYIILILLTGCGVFIKHPEYKKVPEPKIEVKGDYFKYWDNSLNYFKQSIQSNSDVLVICVPGLGAHGGSYNYLQDYLFKNDISSVEIDLRGFGHWQGVKGDLKNIGLHISDLNQIIDYYRMSFPGKKIILLGESLGSSLSLWYRSLYPLKVDGLILTSLVTHHGGNDVGFVTVINLLMGYTFCPSRPVHLGSDQNEYSNDPDFKKWASGTDTLGTDEISPRYLVQANKVVNDSHEFLCRSDNPVLLIQGGKDILSNQKEINNILIKCKTGKIQYEFFPDCHHSLVNDLKRDKVFDTMISWINRNF